MSALSGLESDSVQALFWRDEIPEAMHWLRSEGLGTAIAPDLLDRYVEVDVEGGADRLDSLVGAGLLRRTRDGRYELTAAGSDHGARLFADDFPEAEWAAPSPSACACGCCGGDGDAEAEVDAGSHADSACACGCCGGGELEPHAPGAALAACACGCCGGGSQD